MVTDGRSTLGRAVLIAMALVAALVPGWARAETGAADPAAFYARYAAEVAAAKVAMDAKLPALSPAEKAVVEADRAFADDATARGLAEAFAARFAADGRMFPPGAPVAQGPEAVRALMSGNLTAIWTPVDVIASGTVAATWGIAAFRGSDAKGEPIAFQTRYVTVWRQNIGGVWEIWADLGTPGPNPFSGAAR